MEKLQVLTLNSQGMHMTVGFGNWVVFRKWCKDMMMTFVSSMIADMELLLAYLLLLTNQEMLVSGVSIYPMLRKG
jgi:hypothetical protein